MCASPVPGPRLDVGCHCEQAEASPHGAYHPARRSRDLMSSMIRVLKKNYQGMRAGAF